MSPLLPTMLDYTEVALTWRELGYGQPRPDDVVAIIRQFHRDSLLAVLIRLNLALTHSRGPSQEDIVRKWLVADKADAVVRLLRQGPSARMLFHEGRVLNAIRLALLHCPEDEGLRLETMAELELLTRALLMLSALMFPEASEDMRRAGIFSTMTRGEVFRHAGWRRVQSLGHGSRPPTCRVRACGRSRRSRGTRSWSTATCCRPSTRAMGRCAWSARGFDSPTAAPASMPPPSSSGPA